MKIALVTDDMKTISMHFGQAKYYLVFTIKNGKVIAQCSHQKLSYNDLFCQQQDHTHELHDLDAQSEINITKLVESIIDCDVLLTRGMDRALYDGMQIRCIQPIITNVQNVQEALDAYLAGEIIDHSEFLY
ncbi:MAG: NifB/NifX family molybdenum-iron cluster-binding protein [Chloroflexota bacterium]